MNDIVYISPEFKCDDYQDEDKDQYDVFFNRHKNEEPCFIPERLNGLDKNLCTAIERDEQEPDLRGRAFINLKNIPNGFYTIFYLRIGLPLGINSRLRVMGKAENVHVNLDRSLLNHTI